MSDDAEYSILFRITSKAFQTATCNGWISACRIKAATGSPGGSVADSVAPTESMASSERYDRQIRLWGEAGQASLSRASVLVLGSGATATETLKNLVLPGIASFTIVGGAQCSETHAGNFFVPASDSSPSAASATRHLSELNPAVAGSYIASDAAEFLDDEATAAAFVGRYSIVVVAQMGMGHATLRLIAAACASAGVPLVVARSYGGLGLVRLQHPGGEACVLSSREDPAPDLRIRRPFYELKKLTEDAKVALTDPDRAPHVPFVLILSVALDAFRIQHADALPSSRSEQDELKNLVESLRPAGCPSEAANFEEALQRKHLRLCFGPVPSIPDSVATLFRHERADPAAPRIVRDESPVSPAPLPVPLPTPVSVNGSSASNGRTCARQLRVERDAFWLHVAAVRAFFEETGTLPLPGGLPDMAAGTSEYVALQRAYASKAAADASEVLRHALEIAEHRGAPAEPPTIASVASFCKNVCLAAVLPSRSLLDETDSPSKSGFMSLARETGALDPSIGNSTVAYYPLFRAVDMFYKENGRHAGGNPACLEADLSMVREFLARVKEELGGVPKAIWGDEAEEMVRFASKEVHNVAALVGGVAAQEAVKLITRQFVPLNNTLVFNFSSMTSVSFSA